MRQINEEYQLYKVGIEKKFPGYSVDANYIVVNQTDNELDLEMLKDLLRSSDLNHYAQVKSSIFGSQPKFLKSK